MNPRIAGVLASNSNGDIWVFHRGRIGGGKQGIGPKLFRQNFCGCWELVEGDKMAVVGRPSDRSFTKQAVGFIKEVKRIKDAVARP